MSGRRESPFLLREGRYVVFDALAAGGMGVVHVARAQGDGGFARVVCVKALRETHRGDDDLAAKFRREAEITAHIASPHVVQVTDVVVDERGDIYLVMDLIVGTSLAEAIRGARVAGKSRTPPAIVSAIVSAALLGVDAAHEARVVHRDLTPGNILVSEDGFVRVTDFGIAKILAESPRTGSVELYGKLQYMAPEQLRRAPVDRRVDVYAAGVVLWELLLGAPPFATQHPPALMQEIMVGVTEAPSVHVPALPDALDAVVMRALATDPAARFATAQEMASALIAAVPPAPARDVAAWLLEHAAKPVAEIRARRSAALAWTALTSNVATLVSSPPTAALALSPPEAVAPSPMVASEASSTARAVSPWLLIGVGVVALALTMLVGSALRKPSNDEALQALPRPVPHAGGEAERAVDAAEPALSASTMSSSLPVAVPRGFVAPTREAAAASAAKPSARESCALYDPVSKIVRYDPECVKRMGSKP